MPRAIPPNLLQHLQSSVLTIAIGVRIVRRDTVVQTFTSHPYDLTIAGELYEAGTAQDASAVSAKLGTEGTQLDVVGLLTSDTITDTDLQAGRYDGADVELFICNYTDNPITEKAILLTGNLGEISFGPGHYTAEIRSLMQRLAQPLGELTSQTCLVKRFGDERCKKDLTALRHNRTVAAVTSPLVLRFGGDTIQTGFYDYGVVLFTSGANAGLEMEVKSHINQGSEAVLTLQQAFPFAVAVGDSAQLEEGCRRTLADCQRHGNVINHRAFPHLPGQDRVIQIGRRG